MSAAKHHLQDFPQPLGQVLPTVFSSLSSSQQWIAWGRGQNCVAVVLRRFCVRLLEQAILLERRIESAAVSG